MIQSRVLSETDAQALQAEVRASKGVLAWTIYDCPSDYPAHYVARPFDVCAGVKPYLAVLLSEDIAWLRQVFQRMGLYCITRDEDDDLPIVETWI